MSDVLEGSVIHPVVGDIPDQLPPALGGPPPMDRMILQHVDLTLPGLCVQGTTFGRFVVPADFDIRITGVEVYVQTSPQSPLTFDLMLGNSAAGVALEVASQDHEGSVDLSAYNGGIQVSRGTVIGGIVTIAGGVEDCGEFATIRIDYNII